MVQQVTDPTVLAALNEPQPVTDPSLLEQLDAPAEMPEFTQFGGPAWGPEHYQRVYESKEGKNAVGRVLDAFGTGASTVFGNERLGLSDETLREMQKYGLAMTGTDADITRPFAAFSEGILRPLAFGWDVLSRGGLAVLGGAGAALNQAEAEVGLADKTPDPEATARAFEKLPPVFPGMGLTRIPRPRLIERAREAGVLETETPKVPADVSMPKTPEGTLEAPAMFASKAAQDTAGNINLQNIDSPEDVKDVIRETANSRVIAFGESSPFIDARRGVQTHELTRQLADQLGMTPEQLIKRGVTIAESDASVKLFRGSKGANSNATGRFFFAEADKASAAKYGTVTEYSVPQSTIDKLADLSDPAVVAKLRADDPKNFPNNLKSLGYSGYRVKDVGPEEIFIFPEYQKGFESIPRGARGRLSGPESARKPTAFTAEEALAARNLLVQSAANVKDLSGKVAGGGDAALLEFEEAITRHVAIQEQVAGMTAEAGRALQSFRIQAGEAAIDVKALIERAGGRDRIQDLAQKIATLDPEQVGAFVRKARKATTGDMIREVWINSILSAFRTHEANMIGNALTALARVPETLVTGLVGKLHGGEKVYLGETGATAFGLVHGARDGLVAAWKALKSGEPADLRSKIEVQAHKAIPGKIGEVVRVPGRLLMAEDEFFKTVNYRAEVNRLAVRKATASGLKGRDYQNEVARLKANPTDKMMEKARESALYHSFQADLGRIGKKLMEIRDTVPGGWLVAPFVRTPINITKYAAERSPFGILMRDVRANLFGKNGNIARDTQIARMAIGTAVGYATYSLAAEGFVSGNGPEDPAQRALLRASGWQPYSVKIGDKWYSYNRLDPFGLMMGVSADLYELRHAATADEAENVGAMIIGSASTALLNKTWLSGPAQLMAAVQDARRYGDGYIQRLAGSLVPAGIAQFAPEIDPVLRDARSTLDAIRIRTPLDPIGKVFGLDKIYGKRDVFGEEIRREGTIGGLLTPISESTIRQDPVVRELLALEIYPARLDREINDVELTAQQYDEFQQVAGRLMKTALIQAVTQPGWQQAPEFARKEVVTALIDSSREQGRAFMLMRYPQILDDAIKLKTEPFGLQ